MPILVLRGGKTWPSLATAAERLAAMLTQNRLQILPEAADHALEPAATASSIRNCC